MSIPSSKFRTRAPHAHIRLGNAQRPCRALLETMITTYGRPIFFMVLLMAPAPHVEASSTTFCDQVQGVQETGSAKCFFVPQGRQTWIQAEKKCEEYGGHLASISSAKENELVYSLYHMYSGEHTGDSLWIGFSDAFEEAGEGHFLWSDGNPVEFTNWKQGQPNDEANQQDCTVVSGGGWDDLSCTKRKRFVCSVDTSCIDIGGEMEGNTCLFAPLSKSSREIAEHVCQLYDGAHLATIVNEAQNDVAKRLLESEAGGKAWIGLRKTSKEEEEDNGGECSDLPSAWTDAYGDTCADYAENPQWCDAVIAAKFALSGIDATSACCACGGGRLESWEDGSSSAYRNWAEGHPRARRDSDGEDSDGEDCVALEEKNKTWVERPCEAMMRFVCSFVVPSPPTWVQATEMFIPCDATQWSFEWSDDIDGLDEHETHWRFRWDFTSGTADYYYQSYVKHTWWAGVYPDYYEDYYIDPVHDVVEDHPIEIDRGCFDEFWAQFTINADETFENQEGLSGFGGS